MRNGKDQDTGSASLEVERFIDFMRRRGLDVRPSPDRKKVELFSRRTGKKLCSLAVAEIHGRSKR